MVKARYVLCKRLQEAFGFWIIFSFPSYKCIGSWNMVLYYERN